jgi:UDP-2,4-diacetamido-2,4,6-trideoxy-beta-L-altropyranose hydrolase
MNILFRVDSSFKIGIGHVMRDLVLASLYKKDNIIFAVQNFEGNINNKILKAGYKVELLNSNHLEEMIKIVRKYKIDMIVIDNYDINYAYEKELAKKETNINIFIIDDTYNKHYCDILLNHNISANSKKYKKLVPKKCEIRCGWEYTLLREEFHKQKNKIYKKIKKNKTVFIGMGGADSLNLNIDILKILNKFKNLKIVIVTTEANQNLNELKTYLKNKEWISLKINSNKVAKLIKKSDLGIISCSSIVHEFYFLDIPFIAIKIVKNQNKMYEYLIHNNFDVITKDNLNKLEKKIQNTIK